MQLLLGVSSNTAVKAPMTMSENMPLELIAFWNGLPIFMVQSLVVLLLLFAATFFYMKITRHDEMALIRAGNTAAAISLAGAILGMAIPAAFALASSVTLLDVAIWTIVALVLQIIAFRIADMALKDLPGRIEEGQMGAAVLLVSIKLAAAVVNAAAIGGGAL